MVPKNVWLWPHISIVVFYCCNYFSRHPVWREVTHSLSQTHQPARQWRVSGPNSQAYVTHRVRHRCPGRVWAWNGSWPEISCFAFVASSHRGVYAPPAFARPPIARARHPAVLVWERRVNSGPIQCAVAIKGFLSAESGVTSPLHQPINAHILYLLRFFFFFFCL